MVKMGDEWDGWDEWNGGDGEDGKREEMGRWVGNSTSLEPKY